MRHSAMRVLWGGRRGPANDAVLVAGFFSSTVLQFKTLTSLQYTHARVLLPWGPQKGMGDPHGGQDGGLQGCPGSQQHGFGWPEHVKCLLSHSSLYWFAASVAQACSPLCDR
nr:hypothetical protein Iba_chr14dCG0400 [Ipomoea batatas]